MGYFRLALLVSISEEPDRSSAQGLQREEAVCDFPTLSHSLVPEDEGPRFCESSHAVVYQKDIPVGSMGKARLGLSSPDFI